MNPNPTPRRAALPELLTPRRAIVLTVGALALGGVAFALHGQESADGPTKVARAVAPSITVSLVAPARTRFEQAIAATGTVAAVDELIVGSETAGYRLTDVLVEVGSVVRKGDLLARADDAQLRAQLAQQEALIAQADAELAQARANLERAEALDGSGVYSIEALQTRYTTAAAAEAKLDLALAQRRELEVRLANTRVVAPAAGVIARKSATVGAVVQPGTELFRLIRDGQLEWRAELPSHSLVHVAPGAKAQVLLDDGRTIAATVRLVAPTIDTATRNGLVHVALPPGTSLKAGGHAKGRILVADASLASAAPETLALPESAVLTRDGYPFVYVVGDDQVARLVKIETGARQRGLVEVSGGLAAEARVVGTGAGFVKDGDLVRVAGESARSLAAATPSNRAHTTHSGSPS